MAELDYYKVLGVSSNAGTSLIRQRYQQLAKEYHPDHKGDETSMVVINRAYEVLSSSSKRLEYDNLRIRHQKRRAAANTTHQATRTNRPQTNQRPETKTIEKVMVVIFVVLLLVTLMAGH